MASREEVLDMVVLQSEDNYGEELTVKSVKNNWSVIVEALQSEGELPKNFPAITRAEISSVLRRVQV